jgi:hypothetical protein
MKDSYFQFELLSKLTLPTLDKNKFFPDVKTSSTHMYNFCNFLLQFQPEIKQTIICMIVPKKKIVSNIQTDVCRY